MKWKRIVTMVILATFILSSVAAVSAGSAETPDETKEVKPQPDGPSPLSGDAPTVAIDSPSNGATFCSDSVTIQATVNDAESDDVNVTFYQGDGTEIGTNNTVSTTDATTVQQTWSGLSSWSDYEFYVHVNESSNEANSASTGVYSFEIYDTDMTVDPWNTSATWSASPALESADGVVKAFSFTSDTDTQINFTIAGFSADTQYRVEVDGEYYNRYTTDVDGVMTFNYSSWSTHTFSVSLDVQAPTNPQVEDTTKNTITLNWSESYDADTTYIERSISDLDSWSLGDGIEAYNGTADNFTDTSLTPGTQYFYKIWGYNETQNAYSGDYLRINATTVENAMPEIISLSPENDTSTTSTEIELEVEVADEDGELMDITFYNSTGDSIGEVEAVDNGTYTVNWTDLDTGDHTWYVEVSDSHEVNSSDERELSVETAGTSWIPDTSDWAILGYTASACFLNVLFIVICVVIGLWAYDRFISD